MRSSRARELLIALHGPDVAIMEARREASEAHLDRANIARRERESGSKVYWAMIEGALQRAKRKEMI